MTKVLQNFKFYFVAERKMADFLLAFSYLVEKFFRKLWIAEKGIYEYRLFIFYNGDKPVIGKTYVAAK